MAKLIYDYCDYIITPEQEEFLKGYYTEESLSATLNAYSMQTYRKSEMLFRKFINWLELKTIFA